MAAVVCILLDSYVVGFDAVHTLAVVVVVAVVPAAAEPVFHQSYCIGVGFLLPGTDLRHLYKLAVKLALVFSPFDLCSGYSNCLVHAYVELMMSRLPFD